MTTITFPLPGTPAVPSTYRPVAGWVGYQTWAGANAGPGTTRTVREAEEQETPATQLSADGRCGGYDMAAVLRRRARRAAEAVAAAPVDVREIGRLCGG